MKLAVSGKGGVGKTTFVALAAAAMVERGWEVIAIDADPDANLAAALGLPQADRVTPLAQMEELIAERTGASSKGYGKFFKLNPHVSDLPDRLSVVHGGVRVMVLGAVREGGRGCACPENVLLRSLLNHLILERNEAVIVDMEAGVEHLGRATVQAINPLLVVVEPSLNSVQTAIRVSRLARDIGIKDVCAVANKVQRPAQRELVKTALGEIPLLGVLPYDESLSTVDMEGGSVADHAPRLREEVGRILDELEETYASSPRSPMQEAQQA